MTIKDTIRWILAFLTKGGVFGLLTLIVLNPDLKRAALQWEHFRNPEMLIETDFVGMAEINRDIDDLLEENPALSEARIIEKYVYRHVRYVTDYENWMNVEYWPTAAEVWSRRAEDCDGRAVLAASIMRARGFRSARLVVGLDHMWVKVDKNEKARRPAEIASLLNPAKRVRHELPKSPGMGHYSGLASALLHPKALRETSSTLFADIPALRKTLLILALVLICYFPARNWKGLLLPIVPALLAALLLADSSPKNDLLSWNLGLAVLVLAVFAAAWARSSRGFHPTA